MRRIGNSIFMTTQQSPSTCYYSSPCSCIGLCVVASELSWSGKYERFLGSSKSLVLFFFSHGAFFALPLLPPSNSVSPTSMFFWPSWLFALPSSFSCSSLKDKCCWDLGASYSRSRVRSASSWALAVLSPSHIASPLPFSGVAIEAIVSLGIALAGALDARGFGADPLEPNNIRPC